MEKKKEKEKEKTKNPKKETETATETETETTTDEICNDNMTYEECENAVLIHAMKENQEIIGENMNKNENIQNIINILQLFLIKHKCICYGGTAINAYLPDDAKFYGKADLPDYDFYTPDALNVSTELADLFYREGYNEVEAKSGVHYGTYKVFVDFIPIADITYLNPNIFNNLMKETAVISGIRYAPPNFLRMGIYLELSRPAGYIQRWEKIHERLRLLNKYYPIKQLKACSSFDFYTNLQNIYPPEGKNFTDFSVETETKNTKNEKLISVNSKTSNESQLNCSSNSSGCHSTENKNLYNHVRDNLIEQNAVFLGGYSERLYKKYLPEHLKKTKNIHNVPDFDVLMENPERGSLVLQEYLKNVGFKQITEIKHENIDDVIPVCYEIRVGKNTVANIFGTVACHNYNRIQLVVSPKNRGGINLYINVATIDTIMSFYLLFYYADRFKQLRERILCMAKFMFDIEKHNKPNEKHGLLKQYKMLCIGKQKTLADLRNEKAIKYRELEGNDNSLEYQKWFLNYRPFLLNNGEPLTVVPKIKGEPVSFEEKGELLSVDNKNKGNFEPFVPRRGNNSVIPNDEFRGEKHKHKTRKHAVKRPFTAKPAYSGVTQIIPPFNKRTRTAKRNKNAKYSPVDEQHNPKLKKILQRLAKR